MLDAARLCLLSAAVAAPWATASEPAPAGFDRLSLSIVRVDEVNRSPGGVRSLLIHFHGNAASTEASFRRSGLTGTLLAVNCRGLSSAYRRPFENRELFAHLLDYARAESRSGKEPSEPSAWGRVDVSCFSAGYGAVREILRDERNRKRIDAVLAADSIYASIRREGDQRVVDETQMAPFLNFARFAAVGEKRFLITHSQLPVEPYASTIETADYLLRRLGVARLPIEPGKPGSFEPMSRASRGRFEVLGYPGSDGEAHLRHLREIGGLWKRLRAA